MNLLKKYFEIYASDLVGYFGATLIGAGFIVVGTYIIFRREETLKKQVVPPRYET